MGLGTAYGLAKGGAIEGSALLAGAQTSLYLATSPELEGMSGGYYVNGRATRSSALSYDEGLAGRLWRVSEAMAGFSYSL